MDKRRATPDENTFSEKKERGTVLNLSFLTGTGMAKMLLPALTNRLYFDALNSCPV